MKRFFITIALVLSMSLPSFAQDWSEVAKKLLDSIVFLEGESGSCTGFVSDNDRDLVMTAAHCDMKEMYADLAPAKVFAKDTKNDLMVLKVEGIDRPSLKLAKADPKIGELVASYGYGWGLEKPLFRVHHIAQTDVQIPSLAGLFVVTDTTFVAGMSGGPVVNSKGEVVMIVQRGDASTGLGVPATFIDAKMGKYFEGGDKK